MHVASALMREASLVGQLDVVRSVMSMGGGPDQLTVREAGCPRLGQVGSTLEVVKIVVAGIAIPEHLHLTADLSHRD